MGFSFVVDKLFHMRFCIHNYIFKHLNKFAKTFQQQHLKDNFLQRHQKLAYKRYKWHSDSDWNAKKSQQVQKRAIINTIPSYNFFSLTGSTLEPAKSDENVYCCKLQLWPSELDNDASDRGITGQINLIFLK